MRCWLCLLFFGLCRGFALAQTPSYIHYDVRDGLPGNMVYCGAQDRRGLMWFGTDKGLTCFDGSRFRAYDLEDGLPDLEVLKMKEDSKGRLWLFCFRKEPCYLLNGRIVTQKQDSLLAKINLTSNIHNISEDSSGGLWFFEYSEKVYYSRDNRVVTYTLPEWAVRLEKVGDKYLLLAVNSILQPEPSGVARTLYRTEGQSGWTSIGVSDNHILYSYKEHLILLELKQNQIFKIADLPRSQGQVFTDRSGRFWLCSPATGAVCFDNTKRDLSNPVIYLPGKKVTTMFEDAQGTFWFCTANEGIYALPQNPPVTFQLDIFPSKNIRSVSGNGAGIVFAGDDIGNLHAIGAGGIKTVALGAQDGDNYIRQIIPVNNDAFWAVSDEYLYVSKNKFSRNNRYENQHALKSICLNRDTVWFAASGILGCLPIGNPVSQTVIERRFTTVAADAGGNIWAGGMEGLFSRRDNFQKNLGEDFPEIKSRIMALQPGDENQVWAATPESGLLSLAVRNGRVNAVEVINKRLKTPIKNIQSIFVEPGGRVWMATNRGVYGLGKNNSVLHFDRHDGLADDDVNGVFVSHDTLWAATVSGLTRLVLRPPDERGNFATCVSSLRYKLDNAAVRHQLLDSLSDRHEIAIVSDATGLEMDFAGLDYCSRGNLHFEVERAVHLLPALYLTFDNLIAWSSGAFFDEKDIEQIESATYSLGTYLPPGRYHIRVTAIRASGVRSQYPDIWMITKRSHWYETVWFYLFIWGIVLYGIRRIYKARMAFREMNAAASMLQLQALQAQMNPHFIGNSINAIQQFMHPPDPIKISEYISIFTRLLRRTMLFSEKTFIPFEEELAYDREYLQMIQLRFGERVQLEISGVGAIPPETPVPSMLLQPILENATIHGLAQDGISQIKLRFSLLQDDFKCELTDNGMGFKETQRIKQVAGSARVSKGLAMLRTKIETLNRLYDLDIAISVTDLSETEPAQHGTKACITFNVKKIWKAAKSHPGPGSPESLR